MKYVQKQFLQENVRALQVFLRSSQDLCACTQRLRDNINGDRYSYRSDRKSNSYVAHYSPEV